MLERVRRTEEVTLTDRTSTARVTLPGLGERILNTCHDGNSSNAKGRWSFQVRPWAECGHSLACEMRQIQTVMFSHS